MKPLLPAFASIQFPFEICFAAFVYIMIRNNPCVHLLKIITSNVCVFKVMKAYLFTYSANDFHIAQEAPNNNSLPTFSHSVTDSLTDGFLSNVLKNKIKTLFSKYYKKNDKKRKIIIVVCRSIISNSFGSNEECVSGTIINSELASKLDINTHTLSKHFTQLRSDGILLEQNGRNAEAIDVSLSRGADVRSPADGRSIR